MKSENQGNTPNGNQDAETVATFGKWLVLPFASITFGLSIGLPIALSVMFLDWQETFQVTRAHTAAVHSTCVGLLFGASVIPGYVMSKFGARITIFIGSVLASSGLLLSMFATSIDYLIMSTGVLVGLGCCFIQMPTIPCLTIIFVQYRSMVISMCTVCSAIVIIVFPNVYDYLVDQLSWRGVYGIVACIIVNTSVFGMIITSVTPAKPKSSLKDNVGDESMSPLTDNSEQMSSNGKATSEDFSQQSDQTYGELGDTDDSQSYKVSKFSEQSHALVETTEQKSLSENSSSRKIFSRIKRSKWKFCIDPVFILFVAQCTSALALIFCFPLLIMDFSKTKGFEHSTGVNFLTVVFISSLLGRVIAAVLNLSRHFHSITLYCFFSVMDLVTVSLFSFVESYNNLIVCLSIYGIGYGAVVALQMKCIVDISTVDQKSYPLALGLCCTIEGVVDFLLPIFMGYSVDVTGSYAFILILMSSIGLVSTILLFAGFWRFNMKSKAQAKADKLFVDAT